MNEDTLYRLLPAIYRQRDLTQGRALQAFMRVLESQYSLLQQDIQALNDNWFIETCDSWVVPYLADLLQVDYVKGQRQTLPSHRTLVANTLAHRRAKGTVAALAEAAQEISGWRVLARLGADALALTQSLHFVRPERAGCVDLRAVARRAAAATSKTLPRSVEVRAPRPGGESQAGRYHLQGIALYMCRLQSYPMLNVQPGKRGEGRYTFHPMGVDMPLFNPAYTQELAELPSSPDKLPVPLGRARLRENLRAARAGMPNDDFDDTPAFRIALAAPDQPQLPPRECAVQDMAIADLSDWHAAGEALVTVDPVLGRILIGPAHTLVPVRVSYHYGFSGDLGGGPYPRPTPGTVPEAPADEIWSGRLELAGPTGPGRYTDLASALAAWRASGTDGVLHIADNSTYRWGAAPMTELALGDNARLAIVALSGASPCIEGDLTLRTAGLHGRLELDGLWCCGLLQLVGAPTLVLRHCTLIPGARPSVLADGAGAGLQLTLEHCITGALALDGATLRLAVSDSVVDAGKAQAIAGGPGVQLTLQRCTVLGDVAGDVELIADSLITGSVSAARHGRGQIRYSFAATVSGAPHSFRSHPDAAGAGARSVAPTFTSRHFGAPGYCQLSSHCSAEIREGAESGAEMGAFHLLSQNQRHHYLQRVIAEYLPHSMHAGVFFLT